jgi:hypothetical protein
LRAGRFGEVAHVGRARFGEVAHVGRAGGREVRRRRVRRLRRSGEGGVRSLVVHGSERVVVGGEDGDVDVEERWFLMDLDGWILMTCMRWRRVTRDSATYAWPGP